MSMPARNPVDWSNDDVVSWLGKIEGISSPNAIDSFKKHGVVGRDLFILTRDDLKDLGVTRVPDIRRILDAIGDLNKEDISNRANQSDDGRDLDSSADITNLLREHIGIRLDVDQMPTSEADYWERVECTFILRLLLLRISSEIAGQFYPKSSGGRRHNKSVLLMGIPSSSSEDTSDTLLTLRKKQNAVEKLLQVIEASISLSNENMESLTSWKPALSEVAKAYQISESELDVLRFITTVKITKSALLRSLLPSDDHAETPLVEDKCRCSLVQYVCCLSQLEMSRITDEARPLVKDRVLGEIDDDVLGTEFKFAVPDEVCRVLLGEALSTEDKLKLAGTRLQNIADTSGTDIQSAKGSARSSVTSLESTKKSAQKTVQKMLGDLAMDGSEGEGDEIDIDIEDLMDDAVVIASDEGEGENVDEESIDEREPRPYTCELEYLSDQLAMVMQQIKIANQRLERDLKQASLEAQPRWMKGEGGKKSSIGELSAKLKLSQRKIDASLELTRKEGSFYPRLEELVAQLQLDGFEKSVLIYLAGSMISPLFKSSIASDSFRGSGRKCSVGDLLQTFCESVAEQVAARTYFYRTAKLMQKGLIRLTESYNASDLTDQEVQLDRRVLDCIVGLDKESTEVVQGSYLYDPTVDIDSVVLAPGLKEAIISSTLDFEKFLRYRRQSKFDAVISYGVGLTLMFFGPSGTGKTMMANALAAKVGKKLLLVDFPRLSQQSSNGSSYQSIFREAELSNAILFFDECETLFMKRDSGASSHLTELLTQIERFEGICLLATNRPFDLDEAMFRRISECFEFKPPNHMEREEIWRVVTTHEAVPCDDNIDWNSIALKYELTGGFIKNAVISALQLAVGRDRNSPKIVENDIIEGCKKQMRGALQMAEGDFEERLVPQFGLDEIIVSDSVKEQLKAIVDIEKARKVLFGSWGFDEAMRGCQGTTALFWGPRGSGKQDAAEAIGFELGKPLKVTDLPQLLGKTGKANASIVKDCFREARLMDAVLLLGGISINAEGQRSSSSIEDIRLLNLVVREMMRFPGIVIMQVDVDDSLEGFVSRLEKGLLDGLKFTVPFQPPNRACREQLWKKLLPDNLPTKSLDYTELARASDELNATQIGNAVYRSAALAALKPEASRYVTMDDLENAIEEERKRGTSDYDRYVKSQYI